MPDNAERLLLLAHETFCDLTPGEREVLRCAATGEWADLAPWGPQQPEGKKHKPGGGPLRSAILQWLCADDAQAKRLVHRKGVRVLNATLDQPLDLERAEVPFFFGLHSCRLPHLNAQRAKFSDTLYLRCCRIDGMLDLGGTHIGGQLLCDGALIWGTEGVAIHADGADIGNSVFLSDGFRAVGEVSLLGVKIKGQLVCNGGRFPPPCRRALSADNADIGNNVSLSSDFQAEGEVRLPGAKIKGQLNCKGGQFLNRTGEALIVDGVDIGSSVFLSDGFRAEGDVRFPGAKIAGQLDCKGGHFLNRKGWALSADGVSIGSDVLLSSGFRAEGEVRLPSANIKGQFNWVDGNFLSRKSSALFLQCASIGDLVCLEPRRIRGGIDLFRAILKTGLNITTKSIAAATLDLRGAKVGELIDTRKSWPKTGNLLLDGFQYDNIYQKSPRRATERLEWLGRMPEGQFLPQPYEQLAGWFQKTGHDSEAKDIRVAKEKTRMKQWLTLWSRAYWRALWDKWHGRTEDMEKNGERVPNPAAKPWKLFFTEPIKCLWWHLKGLTIGYGY